MLKVPSYLATAVGYPCGHDVGAHDPTPPNTSPTLFSLAVENTDPYPDPEIVVLVSALG